VREKKTSNEKLEKSVGADSLGDRNGIETSEWKTKKSATNLLPFTAKKNKGGGMEHRENPRGNCNGLSHYRVQGRKKGARRPGGKSGDGAENSKATRGAVKQARNRRGGANHHENIEEE